MKKTTRQIPSAVKLAALAAALAAFINTSQGQSLQDLTNGLVDYYPLDQLSPGTTNVTPDLISRRDMTFSAAMSSANIVTGSHPGMGDSTGVMNFSQSPGPTVIYYQSTGQKPLDRSGDFLPFINQRGATMNFWIKGAANPGNDQRVMAECADNGDGNPFFSLSTQPAGNNNNNLGAFLRLNGTTTDTNGTTVNELSDGTYQTPSFYYEWSQSSQYCTNTIFNNQWHMFTLEIGTNGDVHCFVDGNYDPGNQTTATLDNEGNPAIAPPLAVTNTYYESNIYPPAGVSNPPPNGFVSWVVPGLNEAGAFTAFGGFDRNGGIAAGVPCQMSDLGFWDRALTTNELQWLMTNGISGVTLNPYVIHISSFYADFSEIGQGNSVNIHWNVTGANNTPGGIVISGIGDVSSTPVGSTNITLSKNGTYTFTLTAHNGVVADKTQTITVKTLAGVPTDWHLVQRFDGVFGDTTAGVNSDGWVSMLGYYAGVLDRFNVVTVNGNKVLSPKSGYVPDAANSPVGWDTPGALSYGFLNGLTIPPYQENTLFFRFSVAGATVNTNYPGESLYSGLDFAMGVSDFKFATGPIGGTQPPGGGGTYGPGFHILQYDSSGSYQPQPWDLTAVDYSGSAVTNSYDYLTAATGNPNGLQTNVTYYCWLDISNNDTMQNISGGVTNTINEPLYSLWIQKEGDPSRTLLFSDFHGDRDYSTAGVNNDNPTPYLDKVWVSVASENLLNGDNGAFFATNNMILLDDFYLSKSGFDSTIPRLFNINSIVRNPNSTTITWDSLGSMFQTNTYSVQRSFSLTNPNWVTLTNGLPSGGDFTSYTDNTAGSNPTAFYRITWP